MQHDDSAGSGVNTWRRRILQGVGAAAGVAGLSPARLFAAETDPGALRGTEFDLQIGATPVNFSGAQRLATAVNGRVPAPTLYWREGDTVTLRVTNRLPDTSSIHWHGILVPAEMDGVPGISFSGIHPGETFVYRFEVKQSGTYWYHSHSGFQEQTGLYGPIVITPKGGERVPTDRDYVVMLSDWTDSDPERVFANLKKMSDFFASNQPTFGDFVSDVRSMGLGPAVDKRKMWNRMRMMPTDFSDVTASRNVSGGLHFLINGMPATKNWTGLFRPGEKVRLRFINGAATTIFDVRIPGLKMTVVSADGQDVEPVPVDEFRISVAETYDVIVEPQDDKAYTIFAQSIGRSGFVRATLAPRAGMQAPVPEVDPAGWLTMTDMMGSMSMAGMAGMADMPGMDQKKGQGAGSMQGMDHSKMEGMAMQGMDHSKMQGMDHSKMEGMNMPGMDHSKMAGMQTGSKQDMPMGAGMQHSGQTPKVTHAKTEYGPGVDMHVDMPRTNLDDPGINLRDNGRRVLTYADLRTIGGPIDPREPTREIELHLTGNMNRFMWSFDGQKFSEATPIHFRAGERLRIVLVNDTMMTHPIHLHGMWSELESPDGQFQVRKHTINVQPAQRVTYRVTADAPGHWAYHCHLLYHMEAGMFREVVVS
ncbi:MULTISPECIES: copper resistance system multicopper oxidase [unclassified Massilia]|jgi:FtsP/CotA-like multicopper oxidase with cupredoxin domain|uniref:copper resistance system multicopper oxidase n=1 Tax=unclassified Massilia TaxID=2609279 RepID=UPI001782DEBB|nr:MULTISPECIES: copper resistance system multicopper oxidase [unclassified Massilia]MBD8531661.1 copper resistance system multicopper oxidase [Massilia sp. CFBP 13647]MBD8675106.1 copper resistance system multicopper oxidase [Massilia sp. CFBP 13721]